MGLTFNRTQIEVYYWKEGSRSIDFILRKEETVLTLMIKNTKKEKGFSEVDAFCQLHDSHQNLLVGDCGISVEEFLLTPLEYWIDTAEENMKKRA